MSTVPHPPDGIQQLLPAPPGLLAAMHGLPDDDTGDQAYLPVAYMALVQVTLSGVPHRWVDPVIHHAGRMIPASYTASYRHLAGGA